jgi:exodeoxyribonuclease VII large subunit
MPDFNLDKTIDDDVMSLKPLYTVSQINRLSRELLENQLGQVCIEGEISNLSQPSSGHIYFSLKDAQAQLRCAMFKNWNRQLNFKLKEGLQVIATGQVSLYEPRGDYQLIVEQLDESGLGDLQKAFEALKKQLQAAGFFDKTHKKPLPKFPKSVGIITSPTGAAIHDILHVSKRRFPGIPIIVYGAAVQGEQAKHDIKRAIETANRRQECDVLIVGRGGGSLEDLWPFNEIMVAEAIFASHIPIVSAVGHEVDFTIADFVADLRAPTPSAAAEMIFPEKAYFLQTISQHFSRLYRFITQQFTHHQHRLALMQTKLKHPKQILRETSQRLDNLELRLTQCIQNKLKHHRHKLAMLEIVLNAYNPKTTLARGYCIVSKKPVNTGENKILITQAKQLQLHDSLLLQFSDDVVEAIILNSAVKPE